jgi:hypothetical protein
LDAEEERAEGMHEMSIGKTACIISCEFSSSVLSVSSVVKSVLTGHG